MSKMNKIFDLVWNINWGYSGLEYTPLPTVTRGETIGGCCEHGIFQVFFTFILNTYNPYHSPVLVLLDNSHSF